MDYLLGDEPEDRDSGKEWYTFDEIKIGSIWMAADEQAYGVYVIGKLPSKENPSTGDLVINMFTQRGWIDEPQRYIDWYKLQYRYYLVKE